MAKRDEKSLNFRQGQYQRNLLGVCTRRWEATID